MASHVSLDEQWGDGMKDMLALFEEELLLTKPKDDDKNRRKKNKTPASSGLPEWSTLYFKYLQVYTKLEDCYDQIVHPQKRRDAKKALEACIGRILEIKSFMVVLNEGGEYFDFSELLLSRKQSHDVLNVLPPRFLTDENRALLEAREKFLIAALTTHGLMNVPEPPKPPSGLTVDEAAIIIQAEERGRQARFKIAEIQKIRGRGKVAKDYRAMQEVELARQKDGVEFLTREKAALVIQRVIRGFLGRVRTRRAALEELTFIGMNNFRPPDPDDPRKKLASINEKRKKDQLENELELQNATCTTLDKIKDLEGQEMCEIIQERINVYLNEHREPETGMYEGLPKKKDGGSATIVDPLPALEQPSLEKDMKKGEEKQKKTKGGQVPPPKFPEPDPDGPPKCPDYFRRFVKESHDLYRKHWFDKDDYDNYEQKFVPDLLKQSLRPILFEEMRLLTDENTKKLLKDLKRKMRLEKKARIKQLLKQAKKEGKEKEFRSRLKAEKAQEKKDRAAAKKAKKEREKEKQKEGGPPPPPKKPKRKKDTSMNKSLEIIFDELVKNGILQLCPNRTFSEYVGAENYTPVPPKPGWAALVDPSIAQVKRQVIEYCIFPLATEMVNAKAPFVKSVLLYGGVGVGKTLLVHAACRAAGCTYFNLSPRNTNGKFQGGKKVAQMIQMTFKLAKIMAPSMIYIDEIEKVFISAKKSWGMKDKPNRIKRALNKEMKAIWPGDRVLVIGCTNRPQDCAGKKGPNKKTKTFLSFFTKRIYCPYPDYASRLMIWRTLLERHKAALKYGFDVSILASYSKDFSISTIEQLIQWACTPKRIRSMKRVTLHPQELLDHFYKIQPWDEGTQTRVKDFGKPPPPVEEVPKAGQKRGRKPPPKAEAEAQAK